MIPVDKPPIITKKQVNDVIKKRGSNIPSWVKWDKHHPDYQLLQAQCDADVEWYKEHKK